MTFEEQAPAPEQNEETRRRAEEEELARVIELSKREQGGWGRSAAPNNNAGGSSSQPARQQPQPQSQPAYAQQPVYAQPAQPQADHDPAPLDINTATRVRALYAFKSQETGELNFERGDIIKVLHRGFDEWWRGSVHGKIGIFPVVYVEALPEQTPQELLEEAQDESRVFASLGLVEQLLAALKAVDPEHGDRLEDNAEIQRMYQQSVALQPDIQALLKKYNDQKAELEHISANFTRAIHQYEEFRGAGAPPAGGPREYNGDPRLNQDLTLCSLLPAEPGPVLPASPGAGAIRPAGVRPAA
jgi:signal transducing adaptor molecule